MSSANSIDTQENLPWKPPAKLPAGIRKIENLAYADNPHPRQYLDLYLPEQIVAPVPVILWVHGGGWITGDKAGGPALQLAARGFAVASMNYRFSHDAIFPAQLHDCKAAVRFLRAHASQYGMNPQYIGAWGASAGGHLVSMLGLTANHERFEGTLGNANQSSSVQAVVDWFGPTDFITLGSRDTRTQFLGGDALEFPEKGNAASPVRYVTNQACPFYIVHGDEDPLVAYSQSTTFAAALTSAGVETTFITIPGGRHGGSKFARPEQITAIEQFFRKHLMPESH